MVRFDLLGRKTQAVRKDLVLTVLVQIDSAKAGAARHRHCHGGCNIGRGSRVAGWRGRLGADTSWVGHSNASFRRPRRRWPSRGAACPRRPSKLLRSGFGLRRYHRAQLFASCDVGFLGGRLALVVFCFYLGLLPFYSLPILDSLRVPNGIERVLAACGARGNVGDHHGARRRSHKRILQNLRQFGSTEGDMRTTAAQCADALF
mmetsp:Transcript_29853/g.91622  ORF Transcript_29853/g.91622 Transcript_29853/m.91622 type:complete len:204 (-) Transcript_29853:1967-2578(-)